MEGAPDCGVCVCVPSPLWLYAPASPKAAESLLGEVVLGPLADCPIIVRMVGVGRGGVIGCG